MAYVLARIGCFDVYDNDKYEVHSINLVELSEGSGDYLHCFVAKFTVENLNKDFKVWLP